MLAKLCLKGFGGSLHAIQSFTTCAISCFRMTPLCGTCRELMQLCVRRSLTAVKDFDSDSLNSSCACACMQYILAYAEMPYLSCQTCWRIT